MGRILPRTMKQAGSILIETLIAILIFSLGILAVVGLQGTAISLSNDAKYRSEAALLANALIGQMWVSDRTQATLQANFANPNGSVSTTATGYLAWAWVGNGANQGTSSSPEANTVLNILPVPSGNLPAVSIVADPSTSTPSSLVTITISWQPPGDAVVHSHVVVTQISGG